MNMHEKQQSSFPFSFLVKTNKTRINIKFVKYHNPFNNIHNIWENLLLYSLNLNNYFKHQFICLNQRLIQCENTAKQHNNTITT